MRNHHWIVVWAASIGITGCGVDGGGGSIPTLEADFQVGATIPGWILMSPDGGRAEVRAESVHDGAAWNVILSRPLRTRPKDTHFALAVFDNGTYHSGAPLVRFTSSPTAQAGPGVIVSRRVSNGTIMPDGTLDPGEWDPTGFSALALTPQNELPIGRYPPPMPGTIMAASAYDDVYIYFAFRWADASGTMSNFGPLLQFDGTVWTRRPHRGNDSDGNGILGANEPAVYTANSEDEDRLALFFPIRDEERAYVPGAMGCAASCHTNTALDPMGSEAVHSQNHANDRVDVWEWRASSTAPARGADDRVLLAGMPTMGFSGGGSGFRSDAGRSMFAGNDLPVPQSMFSGPPLGYRALIDETLDFTARTEPGYPVVPTVNANAFPYSEADFNRTGMLPELWTGQSPFFANNYLPPWRQRPPSESRADIEAGSSFNAGMWTVELRRRRVVKSASGAPHPDDIIFDEDADFYGRAWLALTAAEGLPFSISVVNRGRGHGQGETLYPGPLFLSRDATVQGVSTQNLVIHDYSSTFSPSAASDFIDARETRPSPAGGADVGLVLKAGSNGGDELFILARWQDSELDARRDQWTWNGFFWHPEGEEDELRVLFNHTIKDSTFINAGGCASLCHSAPACPNGPAGLAFFRPEINELADLWHWRAGRGGPLGAADDLVVDGRCEDLIPGSSGRARVHGDSGIGAFEANRDPAHPLPRLMAPTDPNASVPFLTLGVPGFQNAIPFADPTAGLPPGGGGGAGVSFAAEVLPIFMARCTQCHPPNGGLDLTSHSGALAGGSSGPAVTPGNAALSLLIRRVTGAVPPPMPLGGPPLTQTQIQTISAWIDEGAANN